MTLGMWVKLEVWVERAFAVEVASLTFFSAFSLLSLTNLSPCSLIMVIDKSLLSTCTLL